MLTMLIVDDQPSVLSALRECFELEPDVQIVGDAGNGREALALAQTLRPDIVLTDIKMPTMDGIAAAIALRDLVPDTRVVVLSIYDDHSTRARAKAAGVVAFVAKHDTAETLITAIRQAGTAARTEL